MNVRLATGAAVVLLGTLFWRSIHVSGEIGTDLLFGWVGFIQSVLPNVTVRWDCVAVFALGLWLVLVLAHLLLRWLYFELGAGLSLHHPAWRLRWSTVLVAVTVLMFIAGISMIGVTHQIGWLLTSKNSIFGEGLKTEYRSTRSNLKEVDLAVYLTSNNSAPADGKPKWPGSKQHSWVTYILPYLASGYYPPELDRSRSWDDPANASTFKKLLPELLNPDFRTAPLRDQNGFGLSHYAANSRIVAPNDQLALDEAFFHQSNLLMIGEVNSEFVAWGDPQNYRDPAIGINTPGGFGGGSVRRGANFVMADSSVRFLSQNIDPKVLEQLSTPNLADPTQ